MIVCVCHRITDRDIVRHAQHGASDLDSLQAQTGLGSTCGCCKDCAQQLLDECLPSGQHHLAHLSLQAPGVAPLPLQAA